MNPNLSKSDRPSRVAALLLAAGFIWCPLTGMATDSIFINTGAINGVPPNVDATNFLNLGTWNISTTAPYQTANTLNYTNENSMVGSVGWEFDFGPSGSGGGRTLSASFFNDSPGTIQANDGVIGNPPTYASFLASYLQVQATNIINKGALIAGANGQILLTGSNVVLSRSEVEITPIQGLGSVNGSTNFSPEVAVYSLFWGTNSMNVTTPNLWNGSRVFVMNGTNAAAFSFQVNGNDFNVPSYSNITNVFPVFNFNGSCGASNLTVQLAPFIPAAGSDSTNIVAATTNITTTNFMGFPNTPTVEPVKIARQAVFLNLPNTNITGQVRFSPSSSISNALQTVGVRLTTTATNPLTQLPQTLSVYLADTLGSETNYGLSSSTAILDSFYTCSGRVYRPANYNVSRTDPIIQNTGLSAFGSGTAGFGMPAANFLYDSSFSNSIVQVRYTGYATFLNDVTSGQQAGTEVTNLGGSIFINANNLDLSRANLSAQGDIMIQANNLVSSTNAVVDCQNLSFNLGSTNSSLNFTNLAKLGSVRLQGNISLWSAVWTNYMMEYLPTYVTNNGSLTFTYITNVTEMDLCALVVDASALSNQAPVTVQDLILHNPNIIVSDSMDVDETLLLDGPSFTLAGEMILSGALQNWVASLAPNLRFFTNDGTLFVPNDAHFGDDTATNYAAFVNNGTIVAGSQTINSADLEIYGLDQTTVGGFQGTMQSGKLANAIISSRAGIQFSGSTLQINQSALTAAGALTLSVSNSLSDNGIGNVFTCNNGFNLPIKPATGDLLATTFQITIPARASISNTWAGLDLGPTVAGFSNNAAIGSLVLTAGGSGNNQEPQFNFNGTGASNGLYVAYLDISRLTNYNFLDGSLVSISPNLTIYFGGASTNPAALNGQFGGHLIYVPGFASQNTKLSGASYNSGSGTFQFSIASASGQTNVVQASTNFLNWLNIGTNIGPLLFIDSNAKNYPYRFYRVQIGP